VVQRQREETQRTSKEKKCEARGGKEDEKTHPFMPQSKENGERSKTMLINHAQATAGVRKPV